MTLWSTKFSGNSVASPSKWPEEVNLPSLNITPRSSEKRRVSSHTELDMPTTTPTTTVAHDMLPPPVLYNSGGQSSRNRRKSARISGLAVHWARFKKRLATGPAPSSSSVVEGSAAESIFARRLQCYQDDEEVNEVVVDRAWSEGIKSSVTNSDLAASPDKTGSQPNQGASDSESVVYEGFWSRNQMLIFLRWRVWPSLVKIFNSRFLDDKSEEHYSQVRFVVPWYGLDFSYAFLGVLVSQETSCPLYRYLDCSQLDSWMRFHTSQSCCDARQNILLCGTCS